MTTSTSNLYQRLGAEPVHCLVLTPFEVSASTTLLSQIATLGVEPEVLSDPLEAMSRAALLDRLEAARAGWGLQSAGRIALIVDTPGACEDIPLLQAAVKRYLPNVTFLEFDPTAETSWSGGSPTASKPSHPFRRVEKNRPVDASIAVGRAPSSTPQLRLVEHAGDVKDAGPDVQPHIAATDSSDDENDEFILDDEQEASMRRLVTQEELAMLLQDDQDCDDDRSAREPNA